MVRLSFLIILLSQKQETAVTICLLSASQINNILAVTNFIYCFPGAATFPPPRRHVCKYCKTSEGRRDERRMGASDEPSIYYGHAGNIVLLVKVSWREDNAFGNKVNIMRLPVSKCKSHLNASSSHVATAPSGPGPPHYRGFTITLRYTTLGRTPLDD